MKVRIKSLGLPKAAYGQQVDYGLSLGRGMQGDPSGSLKPKRTIGGVPREEANLEAEGGETVVGQISGDGIVDHMIIKGPRHSSGGVPMNLPDDSFIFSDTASMKIKDPQILQMFGKSKGSYTPAELAKPYDISKYKAILMDPDTDRLSRNTAEIMIKNIVMKLGALALAQEAKKGFPQGIPEISRPYMEANGISEEDLIPELKAQAEQMQAMQQQEAMQMQQAQAMQQQPQAPQGMPPMMPDGQPVAMPQQPMMDPNQMMAMQQEQQMMPPQPQQGMPMANRGIIAGQYPMTEEEYNSVTPFTGPYSPMHYSVMDVARQNLTSPKPVFLGPRPDSTAIREHDLGQLEAARLQQAAKSAAARPISRVLTRNSYGGTPMAAYGMQLGGYDMPFIMGTGGMMRYDNGGETVDGRTAKKVKTLPGTGTKGRTDQSGYESETIKTPGKERKSAKVARGSGSAPSSGWEDAICKMVRDGATYEQLTDPDVAFAKTGSRKTHMAPGKKSREIFDRCNVDQSIFEEKIDDVYVVPAQTEESCQCKDKDGNPIEGLVVKVSEIPEGIECGTQEFNEMFCVENAEEIVERRKQDGFVAPGRAIPVFETNVPGQDKASIVGANVQGNTIDYKTAVQQLQGKADDAKQKNTRGLNYAQTAAMDAFIDGQVMDKETAAILATYNANAKTGNDLERLQLQKDLALGKTQAQIDMAYNASDAARKAQEVKNRNFNKNFRYNARRKEQIDALMAAGVNALGPNFNLAGQYLQNGLPINANVNMNTSTNDAVMTQYNTYMQANCGGKDSAECRKKFAESIQQASGNIPDGTTTAKFGGSSNPYIMASSVYPFIT